MASRRAIMPMTTSNSTKVKARFHLELDSRQPDDGPPIKNISNLRNKTRIGQTEMNQTSVGRRKLQPSQSELAIPYKRALLPSIESCLKRSSAIDSIKHPV